MLLPARISVYQNESITRRNKIPIFVYLCKPQKGTVVQPMLHKFRDNHRYKTFNIITIQVKVHQIHFQMTFRFIIIIYHYFCMRIRQSRSVAFFKIKSIFTNQTYLIIKVYKFKYIYNLTLKQKSIQVQTFLIRVIIYDTVYGYNISMIPGYDNKTIFFLYQHIN